MRQFKKKIISDWFIIIIGHRLLLELHRIVIQNESWKAKQKRQRITVLLPWSPQFPLLKPSLILIFLSVRQRFLILIVLIKISSGIKIITIAINSIHFLKSIYSFFFSIECQATCFNSSYIFSKSGRNSRDNWRVCTSQGGYLVSIETEEDWQFINDEIQKRGTSNTSTLFMEERRGLDLG